MTTLVERVTCLDPKPIRPIHGIHEQALFLDLLESMRTNGWVGRPLMVLERRNKGYQAITGSHRVAAAKKAGLARIPVIVLGKHEADAVRSSDWGWDREQDRPLSTDAIAKTLEDRGFKLLGGFIRMDVLISIMELRNVSPWSPEAKEYYARAAWNDPELEDVLAVKRWPC